ncbi:hypothetical protein QC764_0022490 [Podospora pseudoanserina]|uniref:Uncharacterized protein n=1 Tax=Podospora pseudoanserina TaxID=2609844 RepID=A0ABR0IQT9_9PEZI|nr:hypothetical protein QC764_0022490 [Podospora pseudoanserina]
MAPALGPGRLGVPLGPSSTTPGRSLTGARSPKNPLAWHHQPTTKQVSATTSLEALQCLALSPPARSEAARESSKDNPVAIWKKVTEPGSVAPRRQPPVSTKRSAI